MSRNNLAVCFSPVLFHLNVETKKKKFYSRQRSRKPQTTKQLTDVNQDDNVFVQNKTGNEEQCSKEITTSVTNDSNQPQTSSGDQQQSAINRKKSTTPQKTLESYKRKCSETFNKAATSIANFSAGIVDTNSYYQTEDIENLSKVGQLCVGDMIKYSMDLFTVYIIIFY